MFYILDNGKLVAFGSDHFKLYQFVDNYLSNLGGLPTNVNLFEGYDYSGYGDKLQMFTYPEKETKVVSYYTHLSQHLIINPNKEWKMGWDQFYHVEEPTTLIGRLVLEGKTFKDIKHESVPLPEEVINNTWMFPNEPVSFIHVIITFENGEVIRYIPKVYKETNTDDAGDTYYKYFPENETPEVIRESFLD